MAEITIGDITTNAMNGTGYYDVLMKSTGVQIQNEFNSGRITGNDYSQVYLGGLQAVLQQSVAFALGRQQADAQAQLTLAQVELTGEQILKVREEIKLVIAQISKMGKEELLIDAQIRQVDANILKTEQEILLIATQILKVEQDIIKSGYEGELIQQKGDTERAQILDEVNGLPVEGVVGKQKALYGAQTDGFARDAEQKLSKIMADSYAIRRTTDTNAPPPEDMEDDDISVVIRKAAEGIGVELPYTPPEE